MSVSPFDHALLSHLFGDAELAALFSVEAELSALVRFEVALARAQADEDLIPQAAAAAIAAAGDGFAPDIEALARGTVRDGVVTVDFVRQLRASLAEAHRPHLHFGATSQDAIDTGLMLRLKPALAHIDSGLNAVIAGLDGLEQRFGERRLMGRTRMQDALPIHVADRVASWRGPLLREAERLSGLADEALVVQLGGPVGTLDGMAGKGPAVRARLAVLLDLGDPGEQWHSQRDRLVALSGGLAAISGSLGKLGQDIALMALTGGEMKLTGGGGSSAMAHKSNPVRAEALVTLARYNGVLVSAMQQAMVHEFERSGAAWGLEWLAFPQMLMTTGGSVRAAAELIGQIVHIGGGDSNGNG
jgi:3-carboxy-cis,cis-muconate cycloisomerase